MKPRVLVAFNSNLFYRKFKMELIDKLSENTELHLVLPNKTAFVNDSSVIFHSLMINQRSANLFSEIRILLGYIKILIFSKPQIVMTFTIKPNIYLGLLTRFIRLPIIQTVSGLGSAYHNSLIPKSIYVLMHNLAFHKKSYIVFENNSIKNIMNSLVKLHNICKVVNGSGVNIDNYPLTQYPFDEPVEFLFIGRIMREKGIYDLLDAFVQLLEFKHNIILSVVGDIENFRDDLSSYYKHKEIVFHGFQDDVRPFIASCHVLVQPSYHEGMSNVILEASAMGRPVIAGNIPGCKEAVDDHKTGFLFEVMSSSDLLIKMQEFLSLDKEVAREMGLAARMKMESEFNRNLVDRVYLDILDQILKLYYEKKL